MEGILLGGNFPERNLFGVEFSVYHMVQRQIGLTDPPPFSLNFYSIFFGYKPIQIGYVLTLTGTGHFFLCAANLLKTGRVVSLTGTGILSNRNGS